MKKILLSFLLSASGLCMVSAEDIENGILVTYEGSETCYSFEDMPTIQYETVGDERYAVLFLKHLTEPVLRVALTGDSQLVVVYGDFSDGIGEVKADKVTVSERDGRKVIQGGRLIIIGRDGRKYDAKGVLLPQ